MKIKKFIEYHRWFCKESRSFVCNQYGEILRPFSYGRKFGLKYNIKQFVYWPIAWVKFMWYSWNDDKKYRRADRRK